MVLDMQTQFIIGLVGSLIAGFAIGTERELRGKVAGVSTHCFVIAGAMLFSFISLPFDPGSPTRIAAQVVTGIGFLGAGIILKDKSEIINVTTAASIWFAAGIGMALGFGLWMIAIICTIAAVLVPRIPHVAGKQHNH